MFIFKFLEFIFLVVSFWVFVQFWSHDVIKGSRNKLKILAVSDMVHGFQHDTKRNWWQFKSAFFLVGLNEIHGPCQNFFFNAKISNQVTKQLQNVSKWKKTRASHLSFVSYFNTWNWSTSSQFTSAHISFHQYIFYGEKVVVYWCSLWHFNERNFIT